MTLTPDQLLDTLRHRYATKKFDATRRISPEAWTALEESLVLAPSSFGLQPWKFLVIESPEIRRQLREESWNQPQVTDASHFVVFTARTDLTGDDITAHIERMAEVQNSSVEALTPMQGMISGFAGNMTAEMRYAWNVRQVYIALGQFMTSAAALGLDSCPMEGISAAAYDRVLGLEGSGFATAVACAVGYRAADDKYAAMPKVRFDRGRIIEHVR